MSLENVTFVQHAYMTGQLGKPRAHKYRRRQRYVHVTNSNSETGHQTPDIYGRQAHYAVCAGASTLHM